jgi:putative phage-type endonuclease
MSAVLLGTETPNTEPWYRLRAGGIGASEIAAVVGLSPYMSAFWLWHFKKGNLPAQKVSDAMDWGHRLEPVVRDWFSDRHEFDVIATPGTYAHAERDWQRANPDGLIYDDEFLPEPIALYEGKTARFPDGFGPSGSDIIPLAYRCQVQHSLDIFDLPRAYVAVLIGGNEPREYVIEADADDQRTLREAGQAFWDSLQNDDEPPIDCSDSTYQAVRDLHPEISGDDVELDPELFEGYGLARERADNATAMQQRLKSEVLNAMGQARRALVDGTPVLRRQPTGKGGVALYPVKEAM